MGLIYLDSCVVIYLAERDPVFGERVHQAIATRTGAQFAMSSLVKLECLVKPLKSGDVVLQRYYESLFAQFVLLEMTDEIYLQAAQLRARFGLRTPDALHLACAQQHGCMELWTNDARLANAGHGLAKNLVVN